MTVDSARLRTPIKGNHLFYGDNLTILRQRIPDESVDLIYLDPPFNSNASYNVLFRAPTGERSQAQIEAFEDTWHWNEVAEEAFDQVMSSGNSDAAEVLRSIRLFLKQSDMMAYLAMMAVRLLELRRVLKLAGGLYLHCDSTASHYLKVLLDAVFGPENFRSEIIWKRSTSHGNVSRSFGALTDTILYYAKGPGFVWNQQYTSFSADYIAEKFRAKDADGRRWQSVTLRNPGVRPNLHYPYTASNGITYQPHPNGWSCNLERMRRYDAEGRLQFPAKAEGQLRLKMYLDETPGVRLQNLWDDIPAVNSQAQERLGYPTQKPLTLLERIIATSSNPGDVVLDPFCGCGTATHAAQKLGRTWLGIDVTHLAISLIEKRINAAFPGIGYAVHGVPVDAAGAAALANADKHQFQLWAASRIDAQPFKDGRKGADGGIDGIIYFKPDGKATERAIVSVKGGGNVGVGMVKDLIATVDREKAKVGVFVTLTKPTRPMLTEAITAGFYEPPHHGKVPKIQILTVDDLFAGRQPQLPFVDTSVFKRAAKEQAEQPGLF